MEQNSKTFSISSNRAMLSFLFLLLQQALAINLFTPDGQRGPLLGTYFGPPGTNATFDYVVVGGGTAGLALATRLSANRSLSVAVIEAGGFYEIDNHNYSSVAGYESYYTGADPANTQPLIDWGFVTTPQPVCLADVLFRQWRLRRAGLAFGLF